MKRLERYDGPLSAEELGSYLERGYAPISRRYLTSIWETEDSPEALISVVKTSGSLASRVEGVSDTARSTLANVQRSGGRVRGENLRREALLVGGGDLTEAIRELVEAGLLVVAPNPGELELDVETIVKNGQFIYHDLAVPASIFESNESFEQHAASHEGLENVELVEPGSTELLELNLLHVAVSLQRTEIRLNKSGSPNRRSLGRVASGIVLPRTTQEIGEDFDPNTLEHIEYTLFVFALAEGLGLIRREDDRLFGDAEATRSFFKSSQELRDRLILQDFRAMRNWSEVSPGPEENYETVGSMDSGRELISLRGYVVSVLKRANFSRWTSIDAVVQLCRLLDEGFFTEALERAQIQDGSGYVRSLVLRALHWVGLLDVGDDEWVRFTVRGRMMLGHVVEEEPVPDQPCLVVQPNMEIMVFLDASTPSVLHEVAVLAERTNIADRVVNFSLNPQHVQRAFSQGRSSESVVKTLSDNSSVPIPDSIRIQLEDWERLHQRVEIRTDGFLLRHRDPERLDMLVDELMVDRQSPAKAVRLGPTSAFMCNVADENLRRFIDRHGVININYLGEVPACLTFVAPLEVSLTPLDSDLITLHELPRIADEIDGEAGKRTFRFSAKRIKSRWPDAPMDQIFTFLEERAIDGLPASQRIALMSLMGSAPAVEFHTDATVLVLDSEASGRIFGEMKACVPLVEAQLGPCAFLLKDGALEEAQRLLREVGIEV